MMALYLWGWVAYTAFMLYSVALVLAKPSEPYKDAVARFYVAVHRSVEVLGLGPAAAVISILVLAWACAVALLWPVLLVNSAYHWARS